MIPRETAVPARSLLASLTLVAVLAGCGQAESPGPGTLPEIEIATDDGPVIVRIEIAETDDERREGLMGRERLAADRGMAFVWEEPVETSFHMKDTLIPLSIAFWDERDRIIATLDMAPCPEDPCPSYGPDEPFVGALEVNLGFFEEHGVDVGDRITIRPVH